MKLWMGALSHAGQVANKATQLSQATPGMFLASGSWRDSVYKNDFPHHEMQNLLPASLTLPPTTEKKGDWIYGS